MKGFKKGIWLVLLWTVILAVTGCQSSNMSSSVTLAEMTENIEKNEELRQQEFRENQKSNFDKQYAEDLYFKDFDAIKEQINEAYVNKFTKLYQAKVDELGVENQIDFFLKADVDCYNASMQKIEEGELTVEDVLANEKEHIRSINLEGYRFEEWDNQIFFDYETRDIAKSYDETGVPFCLIFRAYENKILKEVGIEELKKHDDLILYLDAFNTELYVFRYNSLMGKANSVDSRAEMEVYTDSLEAMYNEKFVFLYPSLKTGIEICAPERNISMAFEFDKCSYIENANRYLPIVAQKLVTEDVNSILEEYSANDRIVSFVAPSYSDVSSEEHTMHVDVNQIEDAPSFINETYPKGIDISLYYLLTENEEIDYQLVKSIGESIHAKYDSRQYKRTIVYVFFYKLSESQRKIAVDLFKDKTMTENYFRPYRGGLDLTDAIITRTDHEGFRFLDIYGEDQGFMYWIKDDISNLSLEEWLQRKHKGIWED